MNTCSQEIRRWLSMFIGRLLEVGRAFYDAAFTISTPPRRATSSSSIIHETAKHS